MRYARLLALATLSSSMIFSTHRSARAETPPDPVDLAAFVDGVVATYVPKSVAGACVSIVDRRGILYEQVIGAAMPYVVLDKVGGWTTRNR